MRKVLIIFILLFIYSKVVAQKNYKLTVEATKIGFNKGDLYVGLYDSESNFLKERLKSVKVQVNNGKATVVFYNLPIGVYAVSSYFDKNKNGKLDTNFLGIPKEPTAMSNNAKGVFGPPKFIDAKFTIAKDTIIKISF